VPLSDERNGVLRGLFRLGKNGSSVCLNLPRPLLFRLGALPGETVVLWIGDDGVAHFKKFAIEETLNNLSVGILPESAHAVKP